MERETKTIASNLKRLIYETGLPPAEVANDHFLEVISHADTHEPSQMPENKGK